MFFYTPNLTSRTMQSDCLPWDFKPSEHLSKQIRHSKQDRQEWYKTANLRHYFYSGIEGENPTARVSRDNPPRLIHAFVADYDVPLFDVRINEIAEGAKVKPTWVETSLGGNRRLVWLLHRPLPVDSFEFCVYVLQKAVEWLNLQSLPGLDLKAFESPSRLYCNGCDWRPLQYPPVPELELQPFFVKCGKGFRFRPTNDEENVALDVVSRELSKAFPNFSWPTEFSLESQGPSFWIPDSTSPLSAIVKPGGLFTFSAHASKSFYSWADLLGKDFIRNVSDEAVALATNDVWWDSKRYWRKIGESYSAADRGEIQIFFKSTCKLGAKPDGAGCSPVDRALDHIHNHQRIEAAVPFVFRPHGQIVYQGRKVLNTYSGRPVPPATGSQKFGPQGDFPFISALLSAIFVPVEQVPIFLAWFKHYYTAAFNQVPMPGQNSVWMGDAGIGKTLVNRELIGVSVGGFVDSSDYLVGGGTFNSHLLSAPHWCLDDDTPSSSPSAQTRVHMMFKKLAANQQFEHNKKFEVAGMTEWMGRIGCTTNLDFLSSRIVGPLDNSSLDKMNLFRCAKKEEFNFVFPSRQETIHKFVVERPAFLRWVLDWIPPEEIERDARYGYKSYQEESLLNQTQQTSSAAPFKEVLMETLSEHFKTHPGLKEWKGTVTQLVRLLHENPYNEIILRSVKIEHVNRFLEQLQRERIISCEASTGSLKTRVWAFTNLEAPIVPILAPIIPDGINNFSR